MRKLHNEEIYDVHSSPSIIRMTKPESWEDAYSTYGDRKGEYKVLVGKPKGENTLGIPGRRKENNIKMDLQEIGCGYVLD